jgi:hypothetical protein
MDSTKVRARLARAGAVSVFALWGALAVSGCGVREPAQELGDGTSALSSASRPLAKGLLQDDRGLPVAGALVEVRGPHDRVVASTTTDPAGIFTLQVRSGTYDVLVTPAARFVPQRFPGQTIVAGDGFELVLVRPAPIEHDGHLSDSQGQPLAQWRVCLFQTCTTTDDQGAFSIAEPIGLVPTESLTLELSKSESLDSFSFDVIVDTSADEPLDIVLPLVHASGTMLDAAGNPVSFGLITSFMCPDSAIRAPNVTGCFLSTAVDVAGRFSVTTLAGDLEVFVLGQTNAFPLILSVADNADLTIVPPAPQPLRGRVADQKGNGVAGQDICLGAKNCPSNKACLFNCAVSDGDGNYSFEMPGGPYVLEVFGNSPSFGSYSTTGEITLSQPTTFDITLPIEHLAGTVFDPDGSPAAGVSVSAGCSSIGFGIFTAGQACSPTSVTGGDGRFQLAFLAPGNVVISALGPTTSASVTLTPAGDDETAIHLANPVPATGQILTGDGTGVPDATVCYSTQQPSRQLCATTGIDGSYQLTVPPGSYSVSVTSAPAAVPFRRLVRDEFVSVPSSAPPVFRFAPLRTLSARVVGNDGSPVAGATVFPESDQVQVPGGTETINGGTQVTDAAGQFVCTDLPGGAPLLGIQLPGASQRSEVQVTTSDGAELAIALQAAATN